MSALSVHFDTISETPMLTTMSRHSDMSDDADSPDVKCFQELPDDTYEAIGSEVRAIRKIIREQQDLPIKVMKYLCFINVPPTIAEEVSLSSARHMFSYDTRSMIIKLVTGAHDAASRGLLCEVRDMVRDMGLHRSIHPVGSKRVRGVSSSKEADESWVPTQHVPGRDAKWPTVVVEVGVSESYRKLKADAEWWLTNSKSDVNLVIIVSINRTTPNIKFEAVSLDISSLRHQRPRYVPTIRQSITTSRRGAQITTSPAVALTIEFEENCVVANQSRASMTLKSHLISWQISQARSGWSKVYKLFLPLLALLAFSNNDTIHNLCYNNRPKCPTHIPGVGAPHQTLRGRNPPTGAV